MRPLNVTTDELALRIPVHVRPTGYVLHETRQYWMPPGALGLPATLYLHRDRVRIVAGLEATHARALRIDGMSALSERRTEHVKTARGARAKRYLKREHLVRLGQPVLAYITELVHRRPKIWIRDIDRMHELLKCHGDNAMCAAPISTSMPCSSVFISPTRVVLGALIERAETEAWSCRDFFTVIVASRSRISSESPDRMPAWISAPNTARRAHHLRSTGLVADAVLGVRDGASATEPAGEEAVVARA